MKLYWSRPAPSTLRPLRSDMAEACARIHAAGFAYPWGQGELERMIADPANIGTAALDPATAKLRGFALSRLVLDEAEVLTIAVDPALRRAGVGRDLLRAHIAEVTASGAARLFLEVNEHNGAALALYARFGFVAVGERKGYYKGRDGKEAAALVMRRDLG